MIVIGTDVLRTENPCVGGSIPPRATFKTLLKRGVFLVAPESLWLTILIHSGGHKVVDTVVLEVQGVWHTTPISRCSFPTLLYKPITTNIQSVDVIAPFGCIR